MGTAACVPHDELETGAAKRNNGGSRLVVLGQLAGADIEASLVSDIADNLHSLFDPVSEDALPIYFGPLLGRLFLEGL